MGNILAKKEAKHSNSTFGFEANIKALPLEVLEHIWSYLDFDNRIHKMVSGDPIFHKIVKRFEN